ncbi:hypothetical protein EPL05_05200 [Mucilaginibacter gilvus]|uniref:Uncharacterized protein n=2 Tax=Mucilaginibacter gilvus TaxID=2305909 RepID=A0A444MT14_9SPHI|nr:hypothetical protein EPL05_05200 [Mucilaginibacter gilvus]
MPLLYNLDGMKFYFTLFLFLIALSARAQKFKPVTKRDSINRTIGYVASWVKLDKTTSLPTLIRKLAGPWEFVETGKGYWIGYTDDMFSIANYGDAAVEPLLAFLDTTKSRIGRIGVVYSLHLIGINSCVAGRFIEEFQSTKARAALLTHLKDDDLGETIMRLLIRDPWLSDVPKLFETMRNVNTNNWYIAGALPRYIGTELPMHQKVLDAIGLLTIKFPFANMNNFNGPYGIEMQTREMLRTMQSFANVNVEESLLNAEIWGGSMSSIRNYASKDTTGTSVHAFLRTLTRT